MKNSAAVSAGRLACLLAVSMGSLPAAHGQDSLGTVEYLLEGPVGEVLVDAGRSLTSLRLQLAAGESRRVLVPVEIYSRASEHALTSDVGPECARALETVSAPEPWTALPPALRARSLPALEVDRPRPAIPRWTWLAAAGLCILALRRRPNLALCLGSVACAGMFWLPAPFSARVAAEVLEGDAASGRWIEVRGARDWLDMEPARGLWLRSLPRPADFHLEVFDVEGQPRWRACGRRARIFSFRELATAPGLDLASNNLTDFDQIWLREGPSPWLARGPWLRGEPRPNIPADAQESLPGWLAAGLPQGVEALVGRSRARGHTRWVRLVGE
ncbi:MAG TPA: hypothetical protein EYG30_13425 [Planctomycetes bacterium]|nr:hypothetical protein [Planctomycetota bacterium]HIL53242.1 hypothetical protein [Planctomycetota bacterium]